MDININFLKTLTKLAEVGSFTKTAKILNMTQPGVSQHIKWLEDYFKVTLLKKHGKSFELTREGEKIFSYAKDLFREHQEFLSSFKEDDPYKGLCRFASPGSFGIKMYSFLLKYNKQHPDLTINYFYAPNTTIEKELLSGELDMGFMSTSPKDSSLDAKAIDKEKICLVAPSSLKDSSFKGLSNLGFIYHPDGPSMAHQVFSLNYPKEFKGIDKIKVSGGNNQISRILEPVALGIGFTVLPEFACKAFLHQKKLQYIHLKKEIVSTIFSVTKKYKPLPKRFDRIIEKFIL